MYVVDANPETSFALSDLHFQCLQGVDRVTGSAYCGSMCCCYPIQKFQDLRVLA